MIEQTPEARWTREILRICSYFGWWRELYRALDDAEAVSLQGLTADQLLGLRDWLRKLEHCAQEGYDHPDSPPAR